ncbi:MAG: IS200/IS605 family transposase [Planctomycetes bacterium]|nr:IS200/IS605 family transposase [Planctomycetota bacterium]
MAGTFTFLGIHFVFSTKNRMPFIDNGMDEKLYAYIGGTIKGIGGRLFEINAVPDHIHFYAHIPKTVSVAKFMEIVKASSSKWVHDTFPDKHDFGWQDGYGAFSISKSSESAVSNIFKTNKNTIEKNHFRRNLKKSSTNMELSIMKIIFGNNGTSCRPFGACVSLRIFQGASPPAISCRPFRPKNLEMHIRPEGLEVYSQG